MADTTTEETPLAAAQARLEAARSILDVSRARVAERKGARDQLLRTKTQEEEAVATLKDEQQNLSHAHLFLLAETAHRRREYIEHLEHMGSAALRAVYGPGYALKFQTFEEKNPKSTTGANLFKMEIMVGSPLEGGTLWTGLLGERGGGVIENIAFPLRLGVLRFQNYQGPVMLDEAWKSMSNDEKINSVARFLKEITDATGRQVIFATHKQDVFGKVASRVLRVEKIDGIANVEVVRTELGDLDSDDDF